MKKLVLSAALGLAALALSAAPSQAWTFGLIPWHCVPGGEKHCCGCGHHGHHCGGCGCCPYNAFSPACCCVNLDLSQLCCNYTACAAPAPCPSYLPDCGGCTASPAAPAAPAATPPTTTGAATQAAPNLVPVPTAGGYGYAPMVPQAVAPMGGQPYYFTGNGR